MSVYIGRLNDQQTYEMYVKSPPLEWAFPQPILCHRIRIFRFYCLLLFSIFGMSREYTMPKNYPTRVISPENFYSPPLRYFQRFNSTLTFWIQHVAMPYSSRGKQCIVVGCDNNQRDVYRWKMTMCELHGEKYEHCICIAPFRFHCLPKNVEHRREWLRLINRKDYNPSGKALIRNIGIQYFSS